MRKPSQRVAASISSPPGPSQWGQVGTDRRTAQTWTGWLSWQPALWIRRAEPASWGGWETAPQGAAARGRVPYAHLVAQSSQIGG